MNEILEELRKPFHPSVIEWKPQSVTKAGDKAMAIAYADVRAYMERLDEVCGLEWSVTYTPWDGRIICHLTVAGFTRSSSGEPDSQSERSEIAGTAAEAQAFKRAGAMFGLGRYLYNLPSQWVEIDQHKKFTEEGKRRLDKIIIDHYARTMIKSSPDFGGPVHPHVMNAKQEAGHRQYEEPAQKVDVKDGAGLLDAVDKLLVSAPVRDRDAEFLAIPSAAQAKPKAATNGFAWPSDDNSLGMCADLMNYEVAIEDGARDLMIKYRGLHASSNGKLLSQGEKSQASYLSSLIEKVMGKGSSPAIMAALTGTSNGLAGWKVKEMIDLLKAGDVATVVALRLVGEAIKEAMGEVA